jgi:hypothetical protein
MTRTARARQAPTRRDGRWLPALIAVVALCGLALACGRVPRAPTSTLRSPSALAATGWCARLDGTATVFEAPGDCDAALVERAVAVANRGNRDVHVLAIDARTPGLADTRTDIPGINGLPVGDGPVGLAALATPGAIAVVSEREPSLAVIDVAAGRAVPFAVDGGTRDWIGLDAPPGHLAVAPDGATLAWSLPSESVVQLSTVGVSCGAGTVLRTDCEPRAQLGPIDAIALDAPPASLAFGPDGRLWVTYVDRPSADAWGAAGAARTERCAGAVCALDSLTIAPSCADGLDNDGDGLVDADDPQCFGGGSREDGVLALGAVGVCSNGLDDDGDGLVDADDDGCRSGADDDEGRPGPALPCENALDDDGDGLVDADDTECGSGATEVGTAVADDEPWALPACANGEDDDRDGLVDANDPDCYGPATGNEATFPLPHAAAVLPLAAGDLIAVLDSVSSQVFFFDAATLERIDANAGDRLRSGEAVVIPSRLPRLLLEDEVLVLEGSLEQGRRIDVRDRVIHIPVTSGIAYTIDVDRTLVVTDAEGTELQRENELLLRRRDASSAEARVDSVSCDFPDTLFAALGVFSASCGDELLPGLAVLDDEEASEEETSWIGQPGAALVQIPERSAWVINEAGDGIETLDVPDQYRIASDRWRITWEGALPGADRDDAVLIDSSTLRLLGSEPCLAFDDVCTSGIALDECPSLVDLCEAGVDLCAEGIDVCAACPGACEGAADLCAADVRPGDHVVLDRPIYAPRDDGSCDRSLGPADALPNVRWEYRIADRSADTLYLELLDASDTGPGLAPPAAYVPSAACWNGTIGIEVITRGAWMLEGERTFGHPSPLEAVAGLCSPREDAELRDGRPRLSEEFVTEYGMRFRIEPGTGELVRGYSISFDVTSGFANRDARSRQFPLGPSVSAGVVTDSLRGRRVVFADDAQDFVWVYSATSFQPIDDPVP